MEISKELLSGVLKLHILEYSCNGHNLYYDYFKDGVTYTSYNMTVGELAYKIEDWIESKDINVIRIKENELYEFYINAYIDEETNELFFENSITSETKIKGIIAVGEFILKEINEKQLQH